MAGDSVVGKLAQWAYGLESGTVGAVTAPTKGLPNLNKASIDSGQEWIEDQKQTGFPMMRIEEVAPDIIAPTFTPETSFVIPYMGQLVALITQKCAQTGSADPFLQTLEPPINAGKTVAYGDSRASNAVYSMTVKQRDGRDVAKAWAASGGVLNRLDIRFPETGRVTVTPSFMFMDLDQEDDSTGETFTLPAASEEKLGRDFVYKFGDGTPVALYSKEVAISLIADIVPHRYGGVNAGSVTTPGGPYRWVYNGWALEGSFSKPIVTGTDPLAKSYFISGGDVGKERLFYIYSSSCADYNSSLIAQESRFTMNIKFDSVTYNWDDETIEEVTFKGLKDTDNNIFKYEQATAATQVAWATQS